MIKNSLYQYGDEDGKVPAHLHFGKEVYDNMVKNKDIVALINADTGEQMTYREMAQMTADIAVSLNRIGVRKGEVVSVCSEKRFEVLPSILGIMCSGAVFSPMDLTYGAHPLLHRLNIVHPKVLFCSSAAYKAHRSTFESAGSIQHYILYGDEKQDGVQLFKEFLVEPVDIESFQPEPVNGWEDIAFIIYSSGTTGLPKGVPVTHLAFSLNTQGIVPDSFRGVSVLNTREWYYTYGLMYTLACLKVCATVVYNTCQEEPRVLNAVQKYKTKVMQMAPSTISEMIKSSILDNYDLSSLELMITSSTPISGDAVAAVKERVPSIKDVIQLYGMSEAGVVSSELGAPLGSRPGSSGIPCRGFIIKVVDIESREPLGPHHRGELCIKGPSVMKAYLNNVQPDCKDTEDFFLTGDVGYYDDDGYFFIVNRIKELIKFNDVSIAPAEFEDILMQHAAVREAGVVGAPHATHGEVPVAFVALQSGATATEDELVNHVNTRVTFRMRLEGGVRFVERLPRGAGDKLNRNELRNMLNNTC